MNKKIFFLLIFGFFIIGLFSNIVIAGEEITISGSLSPGGGSQDWGKGMIFTPKGNITLYNVTKSSSSATYVGLYLGSGAKGGSPGGNIANVTYVGNLATFSPPVNLTNGTQYELLNFLSSTGGNFIGYTGTLSMPSERTNIRWDGAHYDSSIETTDAVEIQSIGVSNISSLQTTIVTSVSPLNNSFYYPTQIILFNGTSNSSGVLSNISLFLNGVRNHTFSTGAINSTNLTLYYLLPEGVYNYTFESCNSGCYFAVNNTFSVSQIKVNSATYNSSTITASTESFKLNLSYDSSAWTNIQAILYYNGTSFNSTKTGGSDNVFFFNTLSIPNVMSPVENTFYWQIQLTNSSGIFNENTPSYAQQVNSIQTINVTNLPCSSGFATAITFNLFDEINLTALNGTFNYNFNYGGIGNNTLLLTYGNISNVNTFNVCINNSLPNYYVGYGQVQYNAPGYAIRDYYLFSGAVLSNVTKTISLFDSQTSIEYPFQVLVEDTALTPFTGDYISLIRWYPNLNQYNVVDMGITDSSGNTILHIIPSDVSYRFGVYSTNGTLLYLAPSTSPTCSAVPCSYTLKIPLTGTSYSNFQNIQYSFTYNQTTGMWIFTYLDPSQTTNDMNMTIYKSSGDSYFPICSNIVYGYTGAVSCNTSLYTGNLVGVVYSNANPFIPIAQLVQTIGSFVFSSKLGLWLSFLIGIPIALIFILISPILAIIGGILALIPAFYFGTVSWAVIGGFAILGGIAAHFIKRTGP
jgi:hypothetical protein